VFRGIVTASLVSLALAGCTAQSFAPSLRANTANQTSPTVHAERGFVDQSPAIVFQWNPTSIKMKDAGPYVGTSLMYSDGNTVVVNYDQQCDYRIDFDLHPGPTRNHVETDGYAFYAYSGKTGSPPFHCTVKALLKNTHGKVVAHADLAVTITYPKKHGHGG
jgi:hypothetical protein